MEPEKTVVNEQETPVKKPASRRRRPKKPAGQPAVQQEAAQAEAPQDAAAEAKPETESGAVPAAETQAPKKKRSGRKRGRKKPAKAEQPEAAESADAAEEPASEAEGEPAPAKKKREPKPEVVPAGFMGMNISDEVLRAIGRMGFDQPTDIQKKTIPLMIVRAKDARWKKSPERPPTTMPSKTIPVNPAQMTPQTFPRSRENLGQMSMIR